MKQKVFTKLPEKERKKKFKGKLAIVFKDDMVIQDNTAVGRVESMFRKADSSFDDITKAKDYYSWGWKLASLPIKGAQVVIQKAPEKVDELDYVEYTEDDLVPELSTLNEPGPTWVQRAVMWLFKQY